ncbi:MAG TPA: cupin domain-containing protein [Allosphingosinicella sp.]|nr:cupin domain-containing protein [Allosphingosinicella sp.]
MTAPPDIVNLSDKLALFSDHWNPRIVGRYNGNEVRVSRLKGEFLWHSHAGTDELFLVLKGRLTIEFRDGVRTLGPGEFLVVPKGVEHRPVAPEEVELLVMDREGEPNTGGEPASELTRARLETL